MKLSDSERERGHSQRVRWPGRYHDTDLKVVALLHSLVFKNSSVFSILIIFGQMIQWTNRSILKLNFSEKKKSVLLINHKDLAAITTTTIILVSLLQPTVRHLESEYRIITVTPGEMMRHKSVHQYFKYVISVKKIFQ